MITAHELRRLMMTAQLTTSPLLTLAAASTAHTRRLTAGSAVRLAPGGGELTVLEGRVWFTRGGGTGDTGDTGDHRLEPGREESRPAVVVGLQEQPLVGDQRDEQAVDVETVAAEHAARGACADAAEQLDAVVDELMAGDGDAARGHAAVLHKSCTQVL